VTADTDAIGFNREPLSRVHRGPLPILAKEVIECLNGERI